MKHINYYESIDGRIFETAEECKSYEYLNTITRGIKQKQLIVECAFNTDGDFYIEGQNHETFPYFIEFFNNVNVDDTTRDAIDFLIGLRDKIYLGNLNGQDALKDWVAMIYMAIFAIKNGKNYFHCLDGNYYGNKISVTWS